MQPDRTTPANTPTTAAPAVPLQETIAALGTIVVALAAIIYPLGFLELIFRLSRVYTSDFTNAWYGASLVPATRGTRVIWDNLRVLAGMVLATTILWRQSPEWRARPATEPALPARRQGVLALPPPIAGLIRSGALVLVLAGVVALGRYAVAADWSARVRVCVIAATAALSSSVALMRWPAALPVSPWKRLLAVAAILCCGLMLTSAFEPGSILPCATLVPAGPAPGTPVKGRLLTHADGYWYVYDEPTDHHPRQLRAIPDAEAGTPLIGPSDKDSKLLACP